MDAIQREMVNLSNSKITTNNQSSSIPSYLAGPPPAPIETKISKEVPYENKPDLSMGRGTIFKESGIDLENNLFKRPEMKGPQNVQVNNILSEFRENVQFSVPPPKNSNPIMTPTYMSENVRHEQQSSIKQPPHTQFTYSSQSQSQSQPQSQSQSQPQSQSQSQSQSQPQSQSQFYEQPLNNIYNDNEQIKEFDFDNIDEMSISSFNVLKEDNSDVISNLSNDDNVSRQKSQIKKTRQNRKISDKNRISMDI
jgi:hypothetical protein